MTELGTIVSYGGSVAPPPEANGEVWMLCDGTAVSRETYEGLFDLVGGTYGTGDRVWTFNLPDLRGRFLRGIDASAGRDLDVAARLPMAEGGERGDHVGSVQGSALGPHVHPMSGGQSLVSDWSDPCTTSWPPYDDEDSGPTDHAGATEDRPKNAGLTFLIRVL